jgi:hypothetical protein
MKKPPKNYYHEPLSECVFNDIEEAKDQSIVSSADALFDSLRNADNNHTANADQLWDNKEEIISNANRLIAVLKDPDKFISTYSLDSKA